MTRWLWSVSLGALTLSSALAAAPAAEGYVKIISPADGARVDAMDPPKLVYEVRAGPKSSSSHVHVHVYIDGKEVGILRQLKGSYALESLSPGQRSLCVKVVNRAHVPIGVEQCVKVTVE